MEDVDTGVAVLGMLADGKVMTTAEARKGNPIAYLTIPGATLTETGRVVLASLRALPRARAAELGIDVAAVDSYARKHGIDPA